MAPILCLVHQQASAYHLYDRVLLVRIFRVDELEEDFPLE
jgi:hypothetical protein